MKLNLSKPIVFLDLETTGVKVATDRIVEIAMLKIMPDDTQEFYLTKINPGIPIPPIVTKIHGISDEDVKDSPSFKDIAHKLHQFIGNSDLAGYNSNKFDIPLLFEEFLRANINFEIKGRRLVDVQNIFHKMEQRTLSAAYRFYCNKEHTDAHTAESDTRATYEILLAQIEKYNTNDEANADKSKNSPISNDIQALHDFSSSNLSADLVGHIVFDEKGNETFNFGKYKGQLVEDVFKKEPSYYDWMMKSEFPLLTKNIITAIKLRAFNKDSVKISGKL